jgi:hypothetical protein
MTHLTSGIEFEPLLTPGFHIFSLVDLRCLCVDPFPHSGTRPHIMTGLESVVDRVSSAGINTDIWVNGSFLTKKEDPNDSDIVLKVDATLIDNGTDDQKAILEWVRSDLKNDHLCDSYIMPIFPDGDPQQVLNDYHIAYWLKQFGFSRGVNYKGIAVVQTTGDV